MHATDFIRRRDRIVAALGGKGGKVSRALQTLVRRAGAVVIVTQRRIIGYRMRDGSVACSKRRYRSEVDARLDMVMIQARAKHSHVPIRVYRCEWCSGWHLTSKRS